MKEVVFEVVAMIETDTVVYPRMMHIPAVDNIQVQGVVNRVVLAPGLAVLVVVVSVSGIAGKYRHLDSFAD